MAVTLDDISPLAVKNISKLHCGVPLLRAEDDFFREKWDRLIKKHFSYEQKIELIEWVQVTSLMSKKQLSAYLERVREYWSKAGVILSFPDNYVQSDDA